MKITDSKQQCFQLSDTVCIADGRQHVTVFNFTLAELEIVLLSEDPSSESASTFCFSSTTQACGEFPQEFGSRQLKTRRGQTFGQNICQLILRGNKLDLEIMPKNPLSNKMVIYLNVFCTSMGDQISC